MLRQYLISCLYTFMNIIYDSKLCFAYLLLSQNKQTIQMSHDKILFMWISAENRNYHLKRMLLFAISQNKFLENWTLTLISWKISWWFMQLCLFIRFIAIPDSFRVVSICKKVLISWNLNFLPIPTICFCVKCVLFNFIS